MKFDYRSLEVFVGVDMAKQHHYALAVTTAGTEVFHRPVLNDQTASGKLIVDASKHGRVALVIDMPSSPAQLLLAVAREHDVPVAYVTGLQMRRAAELYAGQAKTDPRDAWVPTSLWRAGADVINQAGADAINQLVRARSPRVADRISTAVIKALEAQTVTLPGEDTWGEIIAGPVADLERIFEQRKQLRAQIEQVFLEHPLGQVLVTLCGFGPRTGARTLAEIGDPTRFKDGGRLAAYAGLAPVGRRSGKSINNAAASRRGNHRLKNAMFERHVPRRVRRHAARPEREGVLPTQTRRGKRPQRRRDLHRPPTLRPHPHHAHHQPGLPPPPIRKPGKSRLTKRQGHPHPTQDQHRELRRDRRATTCVVPVRVVRLVAMAGTLSTDETAIRARR